MPPSTFPLLSDHLRTSAVLYRWHGRFKIPTKLIVIPGFLNGDSMVVDAKTKAVLTQSIPQRACFINYFSSAKDTGKMQLHISTNRVLNI
jgi:hypothetical protein